MQKVSNEYVESMKSIGRNRGYIRVTLGIVNSEAQENLKVASSSSTAYFSSESVLHGQTVTQIYATCEQNFSRVNGNMYFLPSQGSSASLYPNGIVSDSILGGITFDFTGGDSYDLVGFTIDFGEDYPIAFTITSGSDTLTFTDNDSRYFTTELGLHGVSSFTITPTTMLGGDTRLRIYSLSLGVSNVFTNENTLSYTETSYVSPLADSLPSTDVSITVENYNQYYNPDNPNSVLAFFEVGQEVKVQFGYDTNDDGVIEWLPETVTHLKTWKATDKDATFTATDAFDNISGVYYGGKYYANGISLYDLAEDIFADAGIESYKLDTSLEDIYVNNPMPAVEYAQALQIVANAGRCTLRESRDGMIYIESAYIPDIKDFVLSCNGQTDYSNVANLVSEDSKNAYAIYSKDFTKLNDNKLFFKGSSVDLTKVGYASSAVCNANGVFGTNPVITMEIGTDYSAPSLNIKFRNVAPQEFVIKTYFNGSSVESITVTDPDILFTTETGFAEFDTMELEFTKGAPNSRITIDQIWFGSPNDYTLYRNMFYNSPTATRQDRIKSINVSTFNYKESAEDIKDLVTNVIKNAENKNYTFTFSNPSYGFTASVEEGTASISIVKSSAYSITVALSNVSSTDVKIAIKGYVYDVDEQHYIVNHSGTGKEQTWSNPLISDEEHAKIIEKWLSDYFLGDVEYEFDWRGDPRIDADDLLNLELKTGEIVPIRNYQNTLEFNGAWSGSMKARKVVAPAVEKQEVIPPTITSSLVYNGSEQTATVSSYDHTVVEVTGITGTNAGSYTATLHLIKPNKYEWADGTVEDKSVGWSIGKATGNATLSTTSVTLDNSHTSQTVTISNATGDITVGSSDTSKATVTISGNTITINSVNRASGVATITVSISESSNYTSATKTIDVACNFTVTYVTPPTVSSNLTYNGNQQTATVSTYDPSVVSVTGITATNAGSYTATLSLLDKTNYKWNDNTTADKTAPWSIARATGSITLSKSSLTLSSSKTSDTVAISSVTGSVSNVTVSSSNTSVATASRSSSTITVSSVNSTAGNATITVTLAQTTNYTSATATISVTCEFVQIVTWASGTDAQIAEMLTSHYNGEIDIHDYWHVGDERTVTLSAMSATGVSESHVQQTVTYVLTHSGGKYLSDGVTECAFQVDQKDCLSESGYINSTAQNSGGWESCARRTWCNEVYREAIPSTFKSIFKQFKVVSGAGGTSTSTVETTDYFALRSETEVYNSTLMSQVQEGTPVTYYQSDSTHRTKENGQWGLYWLRSSYPNSTYTGSFCAYQNVNQASAMKTNLPTGIAVFGVI